jgi:hypothetical protein
LWFDQCFFGWLVGLKFNEKKEPVKAVLFQRITDHCILLVSHISGMAFESPDVTMTGAEYVKELKDALLKYIDGLGTDAFSLSIKKAILELDRQLDVLISSAKVREYIPKKVWYEEVTDVFSKLAVLGKILKNEGLRVSAEALYDLYIEKGSP